MLSTDNQTKLEQTYTMALEIESLNVYFIDIYLYYTTKQVSCGTSLSDWIPYFISASIDMPTNSKLPPELIDLIIDYLHNDPHSLSTCSLVHRTWIPSARYHKFFALAIKLDRVDSFRSLLESSPEIAQYVVRLNIYPNEPWTTRVHLDNRTIDLMLEQLTSVRHLDIDGHILPEEEIDTTSTLPRSRIESLSVQRCIIDSIPTLLRLISSFPQTKILSIGRINSLRYPNEWQLNETRLKVEELSVSHFSFTEELSRWLMGPTAPQSPPSVPQLVDAPGRTASTNTTLTRFACSIYRTIHIFRYGAALRTLGNHLKQLKLVVIVNLDTHSDFFQTIEGLPQEDFTIRPCVVLQSLHLTLQLSGQSHYHPSPDIPPCLYTFISQISSPLIEHIKISVEVEDMVDSIQKRHRVLPMRFSQLQESMNWQLLEGMLMPSVFARLSSVTFVGRGDSEMISEMIREQCPILARTSRFAVS